MGAGIECFLRESQQDRRVFPDGIEKYRALAFRCYFPENMDAFGFQQPQVAQRGHTCRLARN
jgi:hypothetical protein